MWIAQDDLEDFFPDDEICDLGSAHRRSVDSAGPRVAVVQLGNGLRQLRLVAAHFVIRQVCWRLDDAMAVADTRRSSEIRRHVFVVHVDCLEYAYAELAEESTERYEEPAPKVADDDVNQTSCTLSKRVLTLYSLSQWI